MQQYKIKIALIAILSAFTVGCFAQNSPTDTQYPASMASGTLPVIYINTDDGGFVVEKSDKKTSKFWMDPMQATEYEPLGSEDAPVTMTLSGRGNSSWTATKKKSYKVKFDKKQSIFGLPKSKNFALMAYVVGWGAAYATNIMGQEIARVTGMPWAPHTIPVELVINGEYQGSYFFSETIKVDPGRVNIFEQEDNETDPAIIPYGWLMEIDNYPDEYQFVIPEKDSTFIRFTQKSPEVLSQEQQDWICPEMKKINGLIYDSDLQDPKWADYIDAQSVARFFIVQEILHDIDGYNGSFYIYKDSGKNAKWTFGPVWDNMADTYHKDCYVAYDPMITEGNTYYAHWIRQLMKYPYLSEVFKQEWAKFYTEENLKAIENTLDAVAAKVGKALEANTLRWKDILPEGQLHNNSWQITHCKLALRNNSAWINEHQDLTKATADVSSISVSNKIFVINGDIISFNTDILQPGSAIITDAMGRIVAYPGAEYDMKSLPKGMYIISAGSTDGKRMSTKMMR